MKERVKENYLKMLKEKLEEEIKSYEIAKKDRSGRAHGYEI